jgi:hypothetical protein
MTSSASKRTFDTFVEPNGTTVLSTSSNSAKKPRTSPDATPVLDKVELWNMVTGLSPTTTQTILFQICHDAPSLSKFVHEAHQTRLAAERAKPAVNFDSYSRECWNTLNKKYKRMSGSKQYEMVGDICDELESAREAILEKAGPNTKWETRRNALEVLRKISKSIMLCDEQVIRHEIMKDGIELGYFAEAMTKLAQEMTEQERDRYREEGLYEKLVDLQTECDWETDMGGLRELYETFDGPGDGEGENDDGDGSDSSNDSVVELPPPPRTRVFSVGELS